MLDLKRRGAGRCAGFVATLEEWIIRHASRRSTCAGERRDDRIGVWVKRPDKGDSYEDKDRGPSAFA